MREKSSVQVVQTRMHARGAALTAEVLLLYLLVIPPTSPQPTTHLLIHPLHPLPSPSLLTPHHPYSLSGPNPSITTNQHPYVPEEESILSLRGGGQQQDVQTAVDQTYRLMTLSHVITQFSSDVTHLSTRSPCLGDNQSVNTHRVPGVSKKEKGEPHRVGVALLITTMVAIKLAGFCFLCKRTLSRYKKRQQQQNAQVLQRIQKSQNELMQAYIKADLVRQMSRKKSEVRVVVTVSIESAAPPGDNTTTRSAPASPGCCSSSGHLQPSASNTSMPSVQQGHTASAAAATLSMNRAELWCSLDGLMRINDEQQQEEEEEDSDEGFQETHNVGGEPHCGDKWDYYCIANEFTQEETSSIRLPTCRGTGAAYPSNGYHSNSYPSSSYHSNSYHSNSNCDHKKDSAPRWRSVDTGGMVSPGYVYVQSNHGYREGAASSSTCPYQQTQDKVIANVRVTTETAYLHNSNHGDRKVQVSTPLGVFTLSDSKTRGGLVRRGSLPSPTPPTSPKSHTSPTPPTSPTPHKHYRQYTRLPTDSPTHTSTPPTCSPISLTPPTSPPPPKHTHQPHYRHYTRLPTDSPTHTSTLDQLPSNQVLEEEVEQEDGM